MSDHELEDVPSLDTVRAAFSTTISRIVEFYQRGPHTYATVDEIVDGIGVNNKAEHATVYSAIDPYSEFAEKRDPEKPLIFRRVAPAEYQFLGYTGDPFDLTHKVGDRNPVLREAYRIFSEVIDDSGLPPLSGPV